MVYEEPIKLNLGCYTSYMPGWINVDINPETKADMHFDITDPLPFSDESISEVRLVHVIEHVSFNKGTKLIDEIYRVLKQGGILNISTPNMLYLAKLIVKGEMDKSVQNPYTMMYGSPDESPWQLHRSAYTPKMLKALLSQFKIVTEEFIYHEVRLKAQK